MTIDVLQILYYAGFAVLGWWLRHRGLIGPTLAPTPTPADRQALIELLKSLLDRLAQAPSPAVNPSAGVFHVPIEVAAGSRVKSE